MEMKKKIYTAEFKQRAVELYKRSDDLCQDFGHFCLRFYAAKGSTSQAFKVLSKNASITSAGTR